MLACPGDCTVNPEQLRLNTMRTHNLGFIDPATMSMAISGGKSLIDSVTNFFGGLFGKDPDKENYDLMREGSWDAFAAIVDAVAAQDAQGRLTQDFLLRRIQEVEEIMRQMAAYTDAALKVVESAWINPRFHDFYDFFKQAVMDWRARLPTLPGSAFSLQAAEFFGGSSMMPLLLVGGLAFLMLRRGRSA